MGTHATIIFVNPHNQMIYYHAIGMDQRILFRVNRLGRNHAFLETCFVFLNKEIFILNYISGLSERDM